MALVREMGRDNKLHAEFNSVGDVFRVIDKLGWKPERSKSSDESGRGGFYTFNNLAEARDVYQNRPESIVNFDHNDEKLVREDTIGKEVRFDVTGDYLDMDRYLEGVPEAFGNAVMGNAKGVFCTINILTIYVYHTKAEYLVHRQKRITRLVDWLEQQGIRCQIVGTMDNVCMYMSTIAKRFQDPFDVNELAIISHPDWLRRIEFLIMEQSKTWQSGYGNADPYDRRMFDYTPKPEDGLYIYVGGYSPYGGGYWGDGGGVKEQIAMLDAAFDHLENQIEQLIEDGLTYNDEPFTVGDHRKQDQIWDSKAKKSKVVKRG